MGGICGFWKGAPSQIPRFPADTKLNVFSLRAGTSNGDEQLPIFLLITRILLLKQASYAHAAGIRQMLSCQNV